MWFIASCERAKVAKKTEPALVIESVPISDLKLDDTNARKHTQKNIDVLKRSLERFGQRRPVLVWQGTVIAGNGTVRAAADAGWSHVYVVRAPDNWSEPKARAYALADNRTAELSSWETDVLGAQLTDLADQGFDLSDLGFTDLQLSDPSSFLLGLDALDNAPIDEEPENDHVTQSMSELYALPYGFTHDQRNTILEAVKKARGDGLPDAPTALVHICQAYLAS